MPRTLPVPCVRRDARLGVLASLALLVLVLAWSGPLQAQLDAGTRDDASWLDASDGDSARHETFFSDGSPDARLGSLPIDAAAQTRSAPRALFVPELSWPAGEPLPEGGSLELLVLVERDGQARLETCTASTAVCRALDHALALSEFTPALVRGVPTAARVQLRFGLIRPADLDAGGVSALGPDHRAARPDGGSGATGPDGSLPPPEEYGAHARVERPKPLATALELEEMREVPGAMGDPFRVIDALPGVVPVMSGLPYVYVRGAPPSATAYFYDDIQLPVLFHLALGPAVVHPAMVGGIDFYPGVAPARYGRKTGGVVAGKALLRPLKPGVHGEVELRLIDLQAYVATPVRSRGRFEVAGRYGYPGLLAQLFDKRAVLQYWDYQLRTVLPLNRASEVTLLALGSYDLIGQRRGGHVERDIELQFHRVEARLNQRGRHFAFHGALSAGFERSGLGDALNVQALRLGPKLWFDLTVGRASLRVGADMLASMGRIYDEKSRQTIDGESDGVTQSHVLSLTDSPLYRSAAARNVVGAYAELNLPFLRSWALEAGLRTDTWITGGSTQSALEPRLLLRTEPREWLALHAAFGLAYQPAVFLVPLPGVSDVAIDRGLQRAMQAELGARVSLPWAFSIETKLFAHFYKNMLALEALDPTDVECTGTLQPLPPTPDGMQTLAMPPISSGAELPTLPTCKERRGFARISAHAFGSEWLIRRAFSEPLSGWLSYTLAKADGRADDGKSLTPNFDVRHVGNLVLQWRITRGWHVALRGLGISGRFPLTSATETDPRARARLPPFFRGDLQVARTWQRRWGDLRLTFDWLNFTLQREPLRWRCPTPTGPCRVQNTGFPITVPLLGLRGTY